MNKFAMLRLVFLGLGAAASLVVSVIEGKQMKQEIAEEVAKQLTKNVD